MVDKNNAECGICGKPYHLCMSCKEKMELSPWKLHTDTAEHYKIFQILRGVTIGVYSKEEANDKLKQVDLSDMSTFRENIKNRLNDILNIDVKDDVKINNEVFNHEHNDENIIVKETKIRNSKKKRNNFVKSLEQ